MAASLLLSQPLLLPRTRRNTPVFCLADHASNQAPPPRPIPGRRLVLLLTSTSVPFAAAAGLSARAQDIPIFGLRKQLRKIEEEAEEIVKEGEKVVEEGIETAEKGITVAGEEIEAAAAAGAGLGFGFGGDLVQAGAVAGAEVVGVLVGVSVVNGILGPESQKSS